MQIYAYNSDLNFSIFGHTTFITIECRRADLVLMSR